MPVAVLQAPEGAQTLSGLREALVRANINPRTGLSTDYLNHFNEMVMMIELYGNEPDIKPDILDWRTLSYRDHFESSGFRATALALRAHALAAPTLKKHFEAIVAEIDTVLLEAQHAVRTEARHGDARRILAESARAVEMLIARAGALINGLSDVEEASADDMQAAVDALFEG